MVLVAVGLPLLLDKQLRDADRLQFGPGHAYYYEQLALGFNYRMTDIQAALGTSQLRRLPQMAERRRELANRYDKILAGQGWILPPRFGDRQSAWHLYVIEREDGDLAARDRVFSRLRERGYGVNLHYLPIHLQPYYQALGFAPGAFPNSELYELLKLRNSLNSKFIVP